ncbi:MAG: hypothetical protein JW720_09415 [Sedimentisphaerales bacterium]|nr:hypothetical protein [Sedimentisphaerales bacterium]
MNKHNNYLAGNTLLEVKDAISSVIAESQPTDEPVLIEEGYERFNIMQYGKTYYGLSQNEGAFEPRKAKNREYKKCFSGNSIAVVKNAISAAMRTQANSIDAARWEPRLVHDNYYGFNIIHFGDKYFGISQSQGEFDINRFHRNEYDHCYQTATADEIRNIIDKVIARSNTSREPILVEEDYRGYNIVLFGDKYYGVFRNGEAFDVSRI